MVDGGRSLAQCLVHDLLGAVNKERPVLLWLDPSKCFLGLWPAVSGALRSKSSEPLDCDRETGSQLDLKIAALALDGKATHPTILYLPGFDTQDLEPRPDGTAPVLWSVYEFRFKGTVWSLDQQEEGRLPNPPSLADYLEHVGVEFVDGETRDRLVEGGSDSLLSLFALERIQVPLDDWPRPVRESDLVNALGGDPREALRELIAAPRNSMRGWRDPQLTLAGISKRYGLEIPPRTKDPEEIADAVLVQLALTEAWEAFGGPDDFPFRARLPESGAQRDQAVKFLRQDVLESRELGSRYRERMLRLEHDYDLTTWSEERDGQPRGLPRLSRNRFRAFLSRFEALGVEDWKAAARLLREERAAFQAASATPWEGTEGDTHWSILSDAARLGDLASEATELSQSLSAEELLDHYVTRWFEIDRLHLSVRSSCARVSGLERVRAVADHLYLRYAEAVSSGLADKMDDVWPPAGRSVRELSDPIWRGGSASRAVMIVDGLRWDLARELADILQAEVTPFMATIPSSTAFGMLVLLPVSIDEVKVDFEKGVSLRTASGTEISSRRGRKTLLEEVLSKEDLKVSFLDLDELLQGVPVPAVERVVIFDNTIDEQGHKGTEEFPVLVEQLIAKIRRGVEKLHEAGVDEVHIVTDHGFLLLPSDMVDALGRPEVTIDQALRREGRWAALKSGVHGSGLVKLPLPLGKETIELGFPRGVRTLMAAEDFMHGGISPQECVIPHIVSRVTLGSVRTEVNIDVITRDLTGGTVPVVITPSAGQGSFGTPVPIQLKVWVEHEGAEVSDVLELEVRPDATELKPPLYLREGAGLAEGSALTLTAIDAETKRELASIPMNLKVAWE